MFRQELDAEAVLYHSESGKVHILNKTAERIWELCDGKHSLGDMERVIRASFEIPEETAIADDVVETIEHFTANGLVSVEEAP